MNQTEKQYYQVETNNGNDEWYRYEEKYSTLTEVQRTGFNLNSEGVRVIRVKETVQVLN